MMGWRKIKREGVCIRQYTLDCMFALLPIVVLGKDNEVILVNKDNWITMRDYIGGHTHYTHYLPVPELKEE